MFVYAECASFPARFCTIEIKKKSKLKLTAIVPKQDLYHNGTTRANFRGQALFQSNGLTVHDDIRPMKVVYLSTYLYILSTYQLTCYRK